MVAIFLHTDSPKKKITCVIPIIKASEKKFLKLIKLKFLLVATEDKYKFNLATEQSLLKLQKRKSILIFYQIKCLCLLKHTTLYTV